MSGALPCALSPTNDYTCVHPVMDSRVYAVGAWTRESPSSRVPSFIWPAGDYIRFSTLVSCEVSLASGLWKEATPEVVEKDCGSTVHLREDVCTTDSVFEHSSSVSTVCQSIARDLMASFGADAEQMRCKACVYSLSIAALMCPSGSSSLGDVLEARSLFAGKCGDLTLCAADAMVLIGIDGYQGVGHLRLGRVFLSRHQPVEATAAFAACDPFLSQLSPKNAALLMKWRTQCTSVPPIPDAGTGAASSNSRYPSTPHLPFSPQVNEDDIAIDVKASSVFIGVPIVITEKMDGGNCCIMDGKVYARTHSHEATHASFGPIKSLCEEIEGSGYSIPRGTRLFGENMFGVHSIEYDNLEGFFYLFGVQQPDGVFAAWDDVVKMAEMIGVPTVPVVFEGRATSLDDIRRVMESQAVKPSGAGVRTLPEGFVVRRREAYAGADFDRNIAKFVRRGHIQTDDSWLRTWKKAVLHAHTKRK